MGRQGLPELPGSLVEYTEILGDYDYFTVLTPYEYCGNKRVAAVGCTMKLNHVQVGRSPLDNAKVRLSGSLCVQRGLDDVEVWFDVDEDLADGLATSGAPWLIALLPYAMEYGGTIEIDRPTDSLLVENALMLGRVYRKWYPNLKPYEIVADRQIISTNADKSVSFFSGGIDGMHTALRHSPLAGPDQVGTVDELLMIWGFDIDLDTPQEFVAMYGNSQAFAEHLGVPLRSMATNIRRPNTYWKRLWGPLCHSMGRAACAHALEGRYKSAVWGSNFLAEDCVPEGSHPWTDPYCSSTNLRTAVDGNAHSRMDKVAFLARYPWALENVHVCYRDLVSRNCGECIKCVRSAIAIDLAGLAGSCRTLPVPLRPEVIQNTYCGDKFERIFFREMLEYARVTGRSDIERSLSIALRRSGYLKPLMDFAEWGKQKTAVWRLSRMLTKAIAG